MCYNAGRRRRASKLVKGGRVDTRSQHDGTELALFGNVATTASPVSLTLPFLQKRCGIGFACAFSATSADRRACLDPTKRIARCAGKVAESGTTARIILVHFDMKREWCKTALCFIVRMSKFG